MPMHMMDRPNPDTQEAREAEAQQINCNAKQHCIDMGCTPGFGGHTKNCRSFMYSIAAFDARHGNLSFDRAVQHGVER